MAACLSLLSFVSIRGYIASGRRQVEAYIDLTPVRAGIVEEPLDYRQTKQIKPRTEIRFSPIA